MFKLSELYYENLSRLLMGRNGRSLIAKKVASLAYARIQGNAALVMHFQNSSLMNEDKQCRTILFHSEGHDTSDQVIFSSFA